MTSMTHPADTRGLFTHRDQARARVISQAVHGYSNDRHYSFFKMLFARTEFKKVLILGVYFGRDICFMLDVAQQLGREISILGVDKFSDDACEDWPEENRHLDWQQAGFGTAPSLQAARANVDKMDRDGSVQIIRQRDDEFLAGCQEQFDLIYIDTAHDYATVKRQIRQALPLLAPGGLMAGDDYSNEGTWGVKQALAEVAPDHIAYMDWIWMAGRQQILPETAEPAPLMPAA